MKNKAVLKLNTKPHTGYGIVSFVMAIIVIIITVVSVLMAAFITDMTRNTQITIGVLGWIGAMLNLIGFSLAFLGEREIEYERLFVHIALVLHGILIVYYLFVVINGFTM